MPITRLESDVLTRAIAAARVLVELQGDLNRLDVDYNGAVDVKNTLTQPDLDAVPSFSGLTKQQCDDGLFALTGTVRTAIANAFAALEQLAARG